MPNYIYMNMYTYHAVHESQKILHLFIARELNCVWLGGSVKQSDAVGKMNLLADTDHLLVSALNWLISL